MPQSSTLFRTGASFPKSVRLRKRSDYLRLSSAGSRLTVRSFILLSLPNGAGHPRAGITVSRRVGNAVVRNRIKRIVREYFRVTMDLLQPRDFVVIARSSAARLTHAELVADLDRLFASQRTV